MKHVTIKGNFHQFTAKAPKEGKIAVLCNKLCVLGTDDKMLAGLCRGSANALAAMQAVNDSAGKLELPCDPQECIVEARSEDGEVVKSHRVTFKKLVIDCTGPVNFAEVHYEEPMRREAAIFALDNLGEPVEISVTPAQMELAGMETASAMQDFVDKTPGVEAVTLSVGGKSATVKKSK